MRRTIGVVAAVAVVALLVGVAFAQMGPGMMALGWAGTRWDSLVPAEHRVAATRALGEEPRGWMAVRMGRMMGGMMGGGMMHRMQGPP